MTTADIRLVLLDRDGTINEDRPDSVKSPAELVMIKGASAAIARLNAANITVALVTNQAVVGRGIISPAMLETIHHHLFDALAVVKARFDGVFICTDAPGVGSIRRKPAPGMLNEALARFRVHPANAVMIGDALTDLEAAFAAKVGPVLVRTGKGAATLANGIPPQLGLISVYDSLADAVDHLMRGN